MLLFPMAGPAFSFRGSLLALVQLAALCCLPAAGADEFDLLRLKWHTFLTGGTNLNIADATISNRVRSLSINASNRWNSMEKSPTRAYLWPDAARTNQSEDITTSYSRLRDMALGWATRGSTLYSNATLAVDILSGLDWLYAQRYNETRTKYDNWWDWEIGSPMWLNDCMVLLHPVLSLDRITNYCRAIDRFSPAVTLTGANRIWKADVVGVRGVVERNSSKVSAARDGLSDVAGGGANNVFKFVTSGDGFYRDGSFIQHTRHPYTAGYGISHFHDAIKLLYWLEGSPWAVTDPLRTNVFTWCWDSFEPLIYRGAMPGFLRGREISRQSSSGDYSPGRAAINAMLQLAQSATPPDALRLNRAIKYWDQADTLTGLADHVPLHLVTPAKQLLADPNIAPRGELIGHYQFPAMDRVMHLRPGFGFGLALFSSRIANYESINNENLKGWYMADGSTWLYNDDLTQFTDAYYPTIDPYHIPGTTADMVPRANSWGQSKTQPESWVGGAVLQDTYGAAGMAFKAIDSSSSLAWTKSWFMLDNEVVCLGAGITAGGAHEIHTTVENRRLNSTGANSFVADGSTPPAALGWTSNYAALTWCALQGAGGYYFPGGAPVQARRYSRTNSWYDINTLPQPTSTLTNPIARHYFSLVLNHGARPTNATCAVVLLPNMTSSQVAAYAAAPDIAVVENTTEAQAVYDAQLGLLAVNFWKPAVKTVGFITANAPACVVTREEGGELFLAVSDPTQTNGGTVTLTLNHSAATAVLDPGLTVTRLSPTIQLVASVAGARGRTLSARFTSGSSNTPPHLTPIASQSVPAGATLVLNAVGSDPDTPAQMLHYRLLAAPAGASIDARTGRLSWTVPSNLAGTQHPFTVAVSEAGWISATGPEADATVRDGAYATNNYGTDPVLVAKLAGAGFARESFLKFQAAALPGPVTQAVLRLTPQAVTLPGTHGLSLASNATWGETTITWSNRPAAGPTMATWTPQAGQPLTIPVPLDWVVSPGPISLRIAALTSTADGYVSYGSREGSVLNWPILELSAASANALTATQTFLVTVTTPVAPRLAAPVWASGQFRLLVEGDPGITYQVQTATNLGQPLWETVWTTNPAVTPFTWSDPNSSNRPQSFYRVRLAPTGGD